MFLVIKMYPREGPDSNITNYTHAKAGTGKGGQLSHPIPIFHQRGPLLPRSLRSVSPSAPCWLHFLPYWARTLWSWFQLASCQHLQFPRPFAFCRVPPCQPPTPDSPQQSISLPCTIRAKPSWSGDSHHPTGGHREGVGFVDLSWILHTASDPFFSGTCPSPRPQVPKTPSSRGQVWTFFSFSSRLPLETALPTSRVALPPRQIGHHTPGLSSRVPGRSGKISPETATTRPWGTSPLISWDSNPNLTWIPTRW